MDWASVHGQSNLPLPWISATAIGFAAGGVVGAMVGFPAGFAVGLVVGGAASMLLQGLVLRRQAIGASWWVAASLAGLAVGVAVSMATGLFASVSIGLARAMTVDILMSCAVFGLSLGTLQWVVLRQRFAHAGWWVVASILGWVVGVPAGRIVGITVGFPAAMVVSMVAGGVVGGQVGFVVTVIAGLVVAGAVLGAVTGRTLLWLLRRPAVDV